MRRFACILVLVYYSAGSIILPCADFSIIPELSQMYQHCKAEEDKDMNCFDFITDHLVNIDGIFDSHENDEQKAHDAGKHHLSSPLQLVVSKPATGLVEPLFETKPVNFFTGNNTYSYDFTGSVFRPPIG